jgi:hypothetical protein
MLGTPHLTAMIREQGRTAPGMAHWAGSGPPDRVCGQCQFKGYWALKGNRHGLGRDVRSAGCEQFFHLTGKHGPAINGNLLAVQILSREASQITHARSVHKQKLH